MNTSFLNTFPVGQPTVESPQPGATRSGTPSAKGPGGAGGIRADEPKVSGDSHKADVFAEMLAAMMSVTSSRVETYVESPEPVAVEGVSTTLTDVPLDGAGSPLFTSSSVSTTAASTGATSSSMMAAVDVVPEGSSQTNPESTTASIAGTPVDASAVGGKAETDSPEVDLESSDVPGPLEPFAKQAAQTAAGMEASGESDPTVEPPIRAVEVKRVLEAPSSSSLESEASSTSAPDASGAPNTELPDSPSGRPIPASNAAVDSDGVVEPAPTVSVADEGDAVPAQSETVPQLPEEVDLALKPTLSVAEQAASVDETEGIEPEPFERPPVNELERELPAQTPSTHPLRAKGQTPTTPVSAAPESPAIGAPPSEPIAGVAPVGDRVPEDAPAIEQAIPQTRSPDPAVPGLDSGMEMTSAIDGAAGSAAGGAVAGHSRDAAAESTPAHVSQQVMQALAAYEAELPAGGSRSFEMLLDPPELGRLLVQMSRTSKGVDVRIAAENETVRSILETSGQDLQQGLQLSGFDLGQFSGSSSNGTFSNGDEFTFAPSLRSFAAGESATTTTTSSPMRSASAVDVVV